MTRLLIDRLRPSTHRRRNDSIEWREIERRRLECSPECGRCGAPAVEAHRAGGCLTSGPYTLEEAEALCYACHVQVDPQVAYGFRTPFDSFIDRLLS